MPLGGTEQILARWLEAGEWWTGEPSQEWVRYLDKKGIRRERSREVPIRFDPDRQTLPYEEDGREDGVLKTRKTRDEKMHLAYLSYAPHYTPARENELGPSVEASRYVPLHMVSGYSFGKGILLPEEMVAYAKRYGMAGVGIADLFSLTGAVELVRNARKADLHPLVGSSFEIETGGQLILFARNKEGYKNLSRLITACHLKEERLFPVLRWARLEEFSEGLLCLTGGSEGPLLPLIMAGQKAKAAALVKRLRMLFPGQLWLEVDRAWNPWDLQHECTLRELGHELGVPLVAGGCITHGLRNHFPVQDVIASAHWLCRIEEVLGRKELTEARRPLRSLNSERFLRRTAEMEHLYADAPELLENTFRVMEACDADVLPERTELPTLFEQPEVALREITFANAALKYNRANPKLQRRIGHELDRICRLGYANHFLIAWDFCRWSNQQDILFSGRGSVVDSVVAYCLDFSRIDAYRHQLHFDRFLPEDGSKRPDIDIDFPASRRDEVRNYIRKKYGEDRVATIAAIGAYCTRGIVREVGKVFGLPESTISYLSKRVHGGVSADRLESALEARPELRGAEIPRERFRWVFALAERMMDIPRNMRAHSSGVIISSRPLAETVPMMWSASLEDEGAHMPIIQWDKRSAKHYFDKFDILCLRGQDVLEGTQVRLREKDAAFSVNQVPINDPNTYATMRAGELIGIPQSASPAMRQAHIRLKTKNLTDASLVQAGIRPGVGGAVKLNEMIARRHGKPYSFNHPDLEAILGNTYGIIVFQEQVDLLLQKFCGYSGGEAEDIREQIHKRRREEFSRQIENQIKEKIRENGYAEQTVDEVYELIAGFQGYGFAQGHALAFAEISVRSIFCQQNYPAEYFAALLDAQPAGYYGPCTLVNEARQRGVSILPVDVNLSELRFKVESVRTSTYLEVPQGGIRVALSQIASISSGLREKVSQMRPFDSIFDFAASTQPDRDELEQLILCGAFEGLHPNRRQLLWAIPSVLDYAKAFANPGTLPLDCPEPVLPTGIRDFNRAEKCIHERRILDLDIEHHLVHFERERIQERGGITTAEARKLPNNRKAIVVGNPIRLRFPPTPSGKRVVFFDLEDETGLLNVTCFDAVYQRDGHAIVCSPYVTIIGESQVRDDHVAFLAKRVFPYRPEILKWLGEEEAPITGAGDYGWGSAPLPIVTADFLVG
jgi:error-prone DNA polymerase